MFGKRSGSVSAQPAVSRVASVSAVSEAPKPAPAFGPPPIQTERRSETYFQTKSLIFGALIEAIDLAALSKLDPESAREEIRDIVNEIITIKNVVMSIAEQEDLLEDICNDVLGYRPARAAAGARRHRRHHGQRRRHVLHRSRRQGPAHQRPLPRQRAADEHLPAHREPGRPPRRRILADLRRAPARRLARQRHRAAARHRRRRAHHPQVQEGQADARSAGQVRLDLAGRRGNPQDHRPRPLQRDHLRRHRLGQDDAAELPDAAISTPTSASSPARTRPSSSCSSPMWCGSKPARRTWRARARSPCATSSRTACACGPSASSSARCADRRRSICCRR